MSNSRSSFLINSILRVFSVMLLNCCEKYSINVASFKKSSIRLLRRARMCSMRWVSESFSCVLSWIMLAIGIECMHRLSTLRKKYPSAVIDLWNTGKVHQSHKCRKASCKTLTIVVSRSLSLQKLFTVFE
jgi:hypothetical protein